MENKWLITYFRSGASLSIMISKLIQLLSVILYKEVKIEAIEIIFRCSHIMVSKFNFV